jgi:hypothetical protein
LAILDFGLAHYPTMSLADICADFRLAILDFGLACTRAMTMFITWLEAIGNPKTC